MRPRMEDDLRMYSELAKQEHELEEGAESDGQAKDVAIQFTTNPDAKPKKGKRKPKK